MRAKTDSLCQVFGSALLTNVTPCDMMGVYGSEGHYQYGPNIRKGDVRMVDPGTEPVFCEAQVPDSWMAVERRATRASGGFPPPPRAIRGSGL